MKRIETTIETVKKDIGDFYKPEQHHFIVMNAVDLGEKIEVQWFFCDYLPPCEVMAFCARIDPQEIIPEIKDIIPSAWVAEAELVDLMGIKIGNIEKGFVLEPDFGGAPLRKKK
ncbi:MAG TPA: NADH-quinone oxidoreductase subunit C [Chitinophagaceae bacterium]|nr:NADH-quinone oxidoreductase subunit C [Chitinophagaceae bacterium]